MSAIANTSSEILVGDRMADVALVTDLVVR